MKLRVKLTQSEMQAFAGYLFRYKKLSVKNNANEILLAGYARDLYVKYSVKLLNHIKANYTLTFSETEALALLVIMDLCACNHPLEQTAILHIRNKIEQYSQQLKNQLR